MAKIEERTPSIADIAEKTGRHYRSPHLVKDDAENGPSRRLWILAAIVVVLAVALLIWRLLR